MKSLKMMVAGALLTLGMTVVGCSSMDTHETVLARAAVISATTQFIDEADDPNSRAERVVEVLDRAAEFADTTATFSLEAMEQEVRDSIDWTELTPQDAVLVDALILYVRVELEERVGAGEVDIGMEQMVELQEVLEWVRDGAVLYTQRGQDHG